VRLSVLVRALCIPLLAFAFSGCSKEGEAVNPKVQDKGPEVKPKPPSGGPGDKGAPVSD